MKLRPCKCGHSHLDHGLNPGPGTECSACDCAAFEPHDPWSEREAVVAYLLDLGLWLTADHVARGVHMQAAREGRLDGLRERVRGMVK
jgi:hypothetical protein